MNFNDKVFIYCQTERDIECRTANVTETVTEGTASKLKTKIKQSVQELEAKQNMNFAI